MRGRETLNRLEAAWTHTSKGVLPTIPVENPTRQIDFIFTRPAGRWTTVKSSVLTEAKASDHRPILAVMELTLFPGRHEKQE